jgi:hypothetical protein
MTAERWLFVDPADAFGGHEVMLTRFVEELASQGRIRPRVLARAGTRLRERVAAHATAEAFPARAAAPRSLFGRVRAALWDARAICSALRAERPALCVVAEGSILSQPVPALVCRLAGARRRLPAADAARVRDGFPDRLGPRPADEAGVRPGTARLDRLDG